MVSYLPATSHLEKFKGNTTNCNFQHYYNYIIIPRLLSRVVIIPFKGPSIQARNADQRVAFTSLKSVKANASNSIGYLVALGKKYKEQGVFDVDNYEQRLMSLLPNCGGRTVKGYANLVWFTEQVSSSEMMIQ